MDISELESFKLSDAIAFHDKLNPKLFIGQRLRPDVEKQLKIIADDFLSELGISELDVIDITISGSNAAYSYTKHSDLDLHIIVDMSKLSNDEVYRELFNAKKNLYNDSHDIKIHGVPIELYVQDSNEPVKSLGEYSLLNKKWLKIPTKRRANLNQAATRLKYEKLRDLIELALRSVDLSKISEVLRTIKRYRQVGLEKGGEFSPENLAYKVLRTQGLLTRLYAMRDKLHSKRLSIEGMYVSETRWTKPTKKFKKLNEELNHVLNLDIHWNKKIELLEALGKQSIISEVLDDNTVRRVKGLVDSFTAKRLRVGKRYIPVPVTILHNEVMFHDIDKNFPPRVPAKFGTLVDISGDDMKLKFDHHEVTYPISEYRTVAAMTVIFVDTIEQYEKLRTYVSLTFDISLPNLKQITDEDYIDALEKTGLTTTDIDPVYKNQPKGMKRQKTDPTYNVNEGTRESIKESIESISYSNEGGSVEGYVVDTDKPQLKNYLQSQHASNKLIDSIASKFRRIGIIKNMYVDDSNRGSGFGSDLMDNAIDNAYYKDAQAILLVADIHEGNEFSLVDWYKKYGFEIIGDAGGDPVMLLDEQWRAREFINKLKSSEKATEDYDPNGPPPGPETKPTMPKGTVRVDVSDVYDWYKLGQNISNLDRVDKNIFGKGPPSTIMAFGSEDEEHKYINQLKNLGLDTTDIDPVDPKQPKGMKRQKVDPTYNVNEAFDQPYKLKWEKSDYGDVDALAKMPDGNYLSIMFNQDENEDGELVWNVEFYRNNSQEVTGEGDAQRVFATVLSAIQTFIKKYKPNRVIFSASKEVEQGQNAQSRARLYDSLVQRYARAWGFKAFRADTGDKVIYELSRINKVKENDTMQYAAEKTSAINPYGGLKDNQYRGSISEASGYIPSEKEKNDPRWKTALTVDIKPDTMKKDAKRFGNKISRAGIPPLLKASGKLCQ